MMGELSFKSEKENILDIITTCALFHAICNMWVWRVDCESFEVLTQPIHLPSLLGRWRHSIKMGTPKWREGSSFLLEGSPVDPRNTCVQARWHGNVCSIKRSTENTNSFNSLCDHNKNTHVVVVINMIYYIHSLRTFGYLCVHLLI